MDPSRVPNQLYVFRKLFSTVDHWAVEKNPHNCFAYILYWSSALTLADYDVDSLINLHYCWVAYHYVCAVTVNASGRMSSVRGELLVPTMKTNGATPSEGGNSPPPQPKTFLRRLGIRKPSLMSLTSPLQTGRTNRTFSLDDLLRPQVPSKVSTIPSPKLPRHHQHNLFTRTPHIIYIYCTLYIYIFIIYSTYTIFIYFYLLAPHLDLL